MGKLILLQGEHQVVTLCCTFFSPFLSLLEGGKPDCANPAEANVEESEPALLIKPEDIVLKEPGSSEKTLRTLLRPSDKVSNHYKTTSSEINAVVGAVPSTCEYVTLFAGVLKGSTNTEGECPLSVLALSPSLY